MGEGRYALTERFQNIEVIEETVASALGVGAHGTPSYYYSVDQAPTSWEQPISWNDFQKMFEPVFKEATKKIVAMFSENQKSLEDFLAIQNANSYSTTGGTVYGSVTVGNDLTITGDTYMNQQLWRKYSGTYKPVGHMHVGMIAPFAGTATVPDGGWLICDGTAYEQAAYPNLYDVIGSTYNTHCGASAPASGYFRVPNYQGRILVGKNPGDSTFDSLTDYGGEKSVTLTSAQSGLPAHSHTLEAQGANVYALGSLFSITGIQNTGTFQTGQNSAQDASQAHNNLQPYAVVNYIIKY